MNQNEILSFIDRFEDSELTYLELQIGDAKIKLKKGEKMVPVPMTLPMGLGQAAAGMNVQAAEFSQSTKQSSENQQSKEGKAGNEASSKMTIKSPIVGVYYKASAPDAEAFVTIGKKVKQGEVMCIIEAMKMMNEIKAPYDLTVKRIYGEDGEMVDCGLVLFEVEKC